MAVYRLEDDSVWFPDAGEAVAEYDGLVAVGGDYGPERLLAAYAQGIFPWPVAEGEDITWFSPDPRFVLKAADLHIPKSLGKVLRKNLFTYTVDQAFPEVIHACASAPRPGQDGTWITQDLEAGYCELQRRGFAHSFEAFATFARRMFESGVPWIDCQVRTDHLARFGAKEIPRSEYLALLRAALDS